jgi:hypothetical protein
VESIDALIAGNISKVALKLHASYFWPVFLIVLGLVFVAAPVLSGRPFHISAFSTVSGLAFAGFGVVLALYQKAFNQAYRRNAQQGVQPDGPASGGPAG